MYNNLVKSFWLCLFFFCVALLLLLLNVLLLAVRPPIFCTISLSISISQSPVSSFDPSIYTQPMLCIGTQ